MNILHIESSLFAENGVSSQLSNQLLARLKATANNTHIIKKSFAEQPVPHFDGKALQALMQAPEEQTPEQQQIVAYADQQIADAKAADLWVIGLPMYNFGVPSMLKAWFDFIARAGVTFRYTDQGPEGLLGDKTVYLLATRGGQYKDSPADSQIPFIKTFLNFLGITSIEVIYAEGLNMGEPTKTRALSEASAHINQLTQGSSIAL